MQKFSTESTKSTGANTTDEANLKVETNAAIGLFRAFSSTYSAAKLTYAVAITSETS